MHKRAMGQQVAHLVMWFSSVDLANHAIQDGLVIAGQRVWDRRMHREPRRCLKCQCLNTNHLEARCTCRETCSTCRDEHRVAKCTETDHDRFWCANCSMEGHTL